MKCCHGHAVCTADDPRFQDDDFTRAALRERRARAAHAHGAAALLFLAGGVALFGVVRSLRRRNC